MLRMKEDMWCCNGRVASVPWLQSVGGPYSCSLEDSSGISSLSLDNKSPWWPWRNMEGFQISVGHGRLVITDFAQESDLQESHIPQGPLMTAQLKWSFIFSNLPVVYHTICLLCWAEGLLPLRASSSFGSRYDVGHSLGQQTAGDTERDTTPPLMTVLWKLCETATRLGWGLAVLEEHPSIPSATARALTPALRGLSHKITFPFPEQRTLELTPHPYPYLPPPCWDNWLVVSKLLPCSSPVKSPVSFKLLLEKVFSKGNPLLSRTHAHCFLAANCPAACLLGRPSWDTTESQETSQGLVKTGQCDVISQTSGKFNGWWRVISSGWKWPSHTRIPMFSMERNKLLGHRLSDLFYHVF